MLCLHAIEKQRFDPKVPFIVPKICRGCKAVHTYFEIHYGHCTDDGYWFLLSLVIYIIFFNLFCEFLLTSYCISQNTWDC